MAVIVLPLVLAWFFTRNVEHLYGAIFYASFPLMGLLYNHFILFNPRRDAAKTQERLVNLEHKLQKNARTTAFFNGWLLLISSPVLFIIGVGKGAEEEGIVGAIVGGLAGAIWFVGGLWMVRRGRRH